MHRHNFLFNVSLLKTIVYLSSVCNFVILLHSAVYLWQYASILPQQAKFEKCQISYVKLAMSNVLQTVSKSQIVQI